MTIAVSMPGKIGDALYTLPTIRALAKKHKCKVDFYTSEYCKPAISLFEYQSEINRVVIPSNYVIENKGAGVQPWEMSIPGGYEAAYQLGFKTWPNCSLPQHFANDAGVTIGHIFYEYPDIKLDCKPVVVGCNVVRGRWLPEIVRVLREEGYTVALVGGPGEGDGEPLDFTGSNFLQTASIMAHATAYIGVFSSNLVIAQGFQIKKIIYAGVGVDMRHAVQNEYSKYYQFADDVPNAAQEAINELRQ